MASSLLDQKEISAECAVPSSLSAPAATPRAARGIFKSAARCRFGGDVLRAV
jgi:hypothetical protein